MGKLNKFECQDACQGFKLHMCTYRQARARMHARVRGVPVFSSARLQRLGTCKRASRANGHLPMLAPDRRMQSAIRDGIPGTSLTPLGYCFEISTARRLKTGKEPDFCWTLR